MHSQDRGDGLGRNGNFVRGKLQVCKSFNREYYEEVYFYIMDIDSAY